MIKPGDQVVPYSDKVDLFVKLQLIKLSSEPMMIRTVARVEKGYYVLETGAKVRKVHLYKPAPDGLELKWKLIKYPNSQHRIICQFVDTNADVIKENLSYEEAISELRSANNGS